METSADHWEKRYHSALEQFGADERRWQRIYDLLRRLVQRLLLTSHGRDERIDCLLDQVRDSVGEHADESSLDTAVNALSEAIRELDPTALPSPATDATTPAIGALLVHVLERLALIPELTENAAHLRESIATADSDTLTAHAERVADLVNRQCALLIADKNRVESLLVKVTEHLGELERYLDHHDDQLRASRDARRDLQDQVRAEVEQLQDDARDADRLESLQTQVTSRLSVIGGHLQGFQQREEQRERDWHMRSEQMSARIHELEKTAQALEGSLHEQRRQAITDKLTGIANREAFEDRIAEACRRLRRSGLTACLLVLDIDRFKDINDRYGHSSGDRALRIVAQQLHAELRETDFLARYGGEEFVILLEALDGEDALTVADKLREHIAALRFRMHDRAMQITLSIGITALRPGDTPDAAFERADRALYQAKDSGRNRCILG